MRGRRPKPPEKPICVGRPQKPDDLGAWGSECWDTVCRTLPLGSLSEADTPMLDGMCRWFQTWRELMSAPGSIDRRRLLAASTAWKLFAEASHRFGMSPADRGRLRMYAKPEDITDPIARLMR